jgi:hypothetical protein
MNQFFDSPTLPKTNLLIVVFTQKNLCKIRAKIINKTKNTRIFFLKYLANKKAIKMVPTKSNIAISNMRYLWTPSASLPNIFLYLQSIYLYKVLQLFMTNY